MKQITLNQIRRVNGRVYIRFGKVVREFNSSAHLAEWVNGVDMDTPEAIDLLLRLLLRWWLIRDPTGATPALVEGKRITIDLSGTTLLEVV